MNLRLWFRFQGVFVRLEKGYGDGSSPALHCRCEELEKLILSYLVRLDNVETGPIAWSLYIQNQIP